MTRRIVLLAAVALFLAAPASAEEVSDFDRFELWSACKPVSLAVAIESLHQDAADIGLAEDAIETAMRSRLRGARLYDAGEREFLAANVTVVHQAFSVRISYYKGVSDLASGQVYAAETWNTSFIGAHGGDAGYILSAVSRGADKFIDEYLRVNAESCGR